MEFWLATDNGPLRVTLPLQESVAFIPEAYRRQVKQLLRGEKQLAHHYLELKDLPPAGLRFYCRASIAS